MERNCPYKLISTYLVKKLSSYYKALGLITIACKFI